MPGPFCIWCIQFRQEHAISRLAFITVPIVVACGCAIVLPPGIDLPLPPGVTPGQAVQFLRSARIDSANLDFSHFDEFNYVHRCVQPPGDVLTAHVSAVGGGQYLLRMTVQAATPSPDCTTPDGCFAPVELPERLLTGAETAQMLDLFRAVPVKIGHFSTACTAIPPCYQLTWDDFTSGTVVCGGVGVSLDVNEFFLSLAAGN